ncbi:serine/threonine protein kinase, AGC [Metarhizium acridum]|nr:serine/threonine protein kinase, AGC [Metarhizium acridum]
MPSSKGSNGSGAQVSHRLRNFFRMNSATSSGSEKDKAAANNASRSSASNNAAAADMSAAKPSRHTKFFSNTVGRLRAHTSASEGNQLEEAMSPTAHANPYFAHQGQPGLRHHNEGSVPPSPPDTPELKVSGPDGIPADQATSETKEELARRLRRVASAPNAQGLFASAASSSVPALPIGIGIPTAERPATAELGKDPLVADSERSESHAIAGEDVLSALPAPSTSLAFRRTYSSNSIKVRNVEVSPASFDKIKLIGKGDVGKVYLVRRRRAAGFML